MSIQKFESFKQRFENTKPIRGRAVECRPIGKRSRDWEQVVKRYIVSEDDSNVDNGEAYGAYLYKTDCVLYSADGSIHIKTDGYETPITAEFINRYLPNDMRCYKKYSKIWVEYKEQSYVLDSKKATVFNYYKSEALEGYVIKNPIQLEQKVIDRTKMKTARDKLKGFRDYAKVMLKLADGWLSNELVDQHASGQADYYGRKGYTLNGVSYDRWNISGSISSKTATELYDAMCEATDETYPKLLCIICAGSQSKESRVCKTMDVERTDYQGNKHMEQQHIREYQYDYKTVDNRINYMIKQACDVYTTKQVALGVVATNTL
jgi:hypothetical protein